MTPQNEDLLLPLSRNEGFALTRVIARGIAAVGLSEHDRDAGGWVLERLLGHLEQRPSAPMPGAQQSAAQPSRSRRGGARAGAGRRTGSRRGGARPGAGRKAATKSAPRRGGARRRPAATGDQNNTGVPGGTGTPPA